MTGHSHAPAYRERRLTLWEWLCYRCERRKLIKGCADTRQSLRATQKRLNKLDRRYGR